MIETYTKNFYTKSKGRHYSHPVVQAFVRPKMKWIRSKIKLKGKKILEVGAGNGYFSNQLAPLCQLTASDISEEQLCLNPAKNKKKASAYKLPYKDNSYDIVISSNLLHHLDNPVLALKEMKRVSKKYLIISEPNRRNPLLYLGCTILRHERNGRKYSKKYLYRLISKAGLGVLHHTYIGGLVTPNSTPSFILRLARPNSTSSLSFFQICICKKAG